MNLAGFIRVHSRGSPIVLLVGEVLLCEEVRHTTTLENWLILSATILVAKCV